MPSSVPTPNPAPAPAPEPSKSSLRELLQVPVGGGVLEPARINKAPGIKWTKKFAKGGKIDGCAQRGKTRGKIV